MATRLSPPHALALHTQTPTTPGHTVSVVVLEASGSLTHERLGDWAAVALSRAVQFRSRLIDKPFGIGQPVWAEIDDFDPRRRIRAATVTAPGGDRELAELLGNLCEATTSGRALWNAWTIDGLAGGRWALAVKLSPVLADGGVGVTGMWKYVLSSKPVPDPPTTSQNDAGAPFSVAALVRDTVSELVENQIAGVWMMTDLAVSGLVEARRRLRRRAEAATDAPSAPAARGLRGFAAGAPLTHRRSMAFTSIRVSDLSAVGSAFGGGRANVLLAACALSLQRSMRGRHGVPDEPLTMVVPLSPSGGDTSTVGEVRIPAWLDEPVNVLTTMHTATERLSMASADHEIGHEQFDLASAVSLVPPRLAPLASKVYTGLGLAGTSGCHARVTYLPGPRSAAYCAGSAVVGVYTAEPLSQDCVVNIVVTLRGGSLDVCLIGCPDNTLEVDGIAKGVAEAVAALVDAAGASPRGHGESVVTEMASRASPGSTP